MPPARIFFERNNSYVIVSCSWHTSLGPQKEQVFKTGCDSFMEITASPQLYLETVRKQKLGQLSPATSHLRISFTLWMGPLCTNSTTRIASSGINRQTWTLSSLFGSLLSIMETWPPPNICHFHWTHKWQSYLNFVLPSSWTNVITVQSVPLYFACVIKHLKALGMILLAMLPNNTAFLRIPWLMMNKTMNNDFNVAKCTQTL